MKLGEVDEKPPSYHKSIHSIRMAHDNTIKRERRLRHLRCALVTRWKVGCCLPPLGLCSLLGSYFAGGLDKVHSWHDKEHEVKI